MNPHSKQQPTVVTVLSQPRRRVLAACGATIAAVFALVACGSTKPSVTPTGTGGSSVLRVTITNHGNSIAGNLDRRPGPVTFAVSAVSSQSGDHQFQLFKLAGGYSLAQMDADGQGAFGSHPDPSAAKRYLANVTSLGGVEIFPGAHAASFTQTLSAGTYYAGELPQVHTIHVSGLPAAGVKPSTSGTITAFDDHWQTSAPTLAHHGSVIVANAGTQPHFLILSPIAAGTTKVQVGGYLQRTGAAPDAPPPPFARNGPQLGTAILSPGAQMVFSYDLPAGEYAMVCFFPDPDNGGRPQALEGLYDVITLR